MTETNVTYPVHWTAIKTLKPRPNNRNQHSDEQIQMLVRLIEHYGWRHPIIVSNQSGYVVAGHARLDAAKRMKLKEVPVQYQDFKSEDEEYAFHVADNAIPAWAELDLKGINADLPQLGPDFDIDLLGIKGLALDAPNFEPGSEEGQGQLDQKKIVILECPHCREHFEQSQAKIIA
jgi:hypothetical protein